MKLEDSYQRERAQKPPVKYSDPNESLQELSSENHYHQQRHQQQRKENKRRRHRSVQQQKKEQKKVIKTTQQRKKNLRQRRQQQESQNRQQRIHNFSGKVSDPYIADPFDGQKQHMNRTYLSSNLQSLQSGKSNTSRHARQVEALKCQADSKGLVGREEGDFLILYFYYQIDKIPGITVTQINDETLVDVETVLLDLMIPYFFPVSCGIPINQTLKEISRENIIGLTSNPQDFVLPGMKCKGARVTTLCHVVSGAVEVYSKNFAKIEVEEFLQVVLLKIIDSGRLSERIPEVDNIVLLDTAFEPFKFLSTMAPENKDRSPASTSSITPTLTMTPIVVIPVYGYIIIGMVALLMFSLCCLLFGIFTARFKKDDDADVGSMSKSEDDISDSVYVVPAGTKDEMKIEQSIHSSDSDDSYKKKIREDTISDNVEENRIVKKVEDLGFEDIFMNEIHSDEESYSHQSSQYSELRHKQNKRRSDSKNSNSKSSEKEGNNSFNQGALKNVGHKLW